MIVMNFKLLSKKRGLPAASIAAAYDLGPISLPSIRVISRVAGGVAPAVGGGPESDAGQPATVGF